MEILVASISAIGVIIAAWISVRRKNRKVVQVESKIDRLEVQQQETAKSLEEELIERYGFKAESITSQSETLNSEGDVRVTRGWKGIKVSPGVTLAYIPGHFWMGTPGASIKKGPTIIGAAFPKAIRPVATRQGNNCDYRMEITGSLTSDDPPLDYGLQIEYEKAVLMSRQDVEAAYKDDDFKQDYHSFDVDIPTDRLELEVVFPQGISVTTFPGVFYGRSELVHEKEYNRVKHGFEATPRGGRFIIDGPLVGFRYFIYWTLDQ